MSKSGSASTEDGSATKPLIYVVDDEPMVGEVIQAILEVEHYQVVLFLDPFHALETFKEESRKPDVLVTDYVMAALNGMQLIERCKRIHPPLKSILISGNAGQGVMDHYEVKADGFICKPFQPKVLLEQIHTLLVT